MRCLLTLILLIPALRIASAAPATQPGQIDFLDYFLQSDDVGERWTLGGTDVRPDRDPDGTSTRTYVLNKWSTPDCYEVFKITDHQVQIRYEVVRAAGKNGTGNWIRRYREIDAEGAVPGAVWIPRFVKPGGEGFLSRFDQDRFIFDEASHSYVKDTAGSAKDFPSYLCCVWANENWRGNNKTGFAINRVLRLISQWQREGLMLEMYDYAKGKGLVAWRWLERVSTLKPKEGDDTGKIFHCEEGFVWVEKGSGAPKVWKWTDGKKTADLEVIPFTSYWKPEMGEQWYVVYRDSTREGPLVKKMERVRHDFSLPEWIIKPGATIADLPKE